MRGQARLEAQAARDAGDLILTGSLLDDAGQPLVNEGVAVAFVREADGQPLVLADGGNVARGCTSAFRDAATPTLHPASPGGPVVVQTEEAGRFCLRITAPHDRYMVTFAWDASGLVDGAKLELPVDTGRQAIALRFDPAPTVFSLDKAFTVLEVRASYEENGLSRAGTSLPIHLTNERGDPLGSAITNAAGAARITVPSERLGPPGRGTLQLSFVGNDEFTRSVHTAPVERRARVSLATEPERAAVSPEDGVPLHVSAKTSGGGVPSGSVEALVDGIVVGAAPLEAGAASVLATFVPPEGARELELHLRYLPSAPWFEPGDEVVVKVPIKARTPLRQLPLALAGLAVVLWLVAGRLKRAQPAAPASSTAPKAAPEGEARIDVVRATRDARAGWSGRVLDAHDGTPVKDARVRIERAGFERAQVIASVHANAMGRFELRAPADAGPRGGPAGASDELVVEGALHAELRQTLPACGEIEVSLVLRKRKLVERLVMWAKKRGRPFDAQPEPTPGHVRRAAGADFGTARWADAVERAAYGGGDVDARGEAEVDRLAPDPKAAAVPSVTVQDIPPRTPS